MKTENKVKHTPGPWSYGDGVITCRKEAFMPNNAKRIICIARCDDKEVNFLENISMGELHANARLIASAPELLEALKNCINALYGGYSPHDAIEQAKQVIAKAEGN